MKNISFYQNIIAVYSLIEFPQRARNVPTKPRSRSVPDVVDTKFAAPNGTAH